MPCYDMVSHNFFIIHDLCLETMDIMDIMDITDIMDIMDITDIMDMHALCRRLPQPTAAAPVAALVPSRSARLPQPTCSSE